MIESPLNGPITTFASLCATTMEALGVAIITLATFWALSVACWRLLRGAQSRPEIFHDLRQFLGRGILLGLEVLIAADIIFTVAVELNFETIGVLALVVLVRTFLSFTLEVELTGRWPWQAQTQEASSLIPPKDQTD